VDGVDYRFISLEEFQAKIENDEFVEWSEVYGEYYGRLKGDLEKQMRSGDVVVGIDPQGAAKLLAKYPEGIFIFLLPRSEAALETQLRGRRTDDEASIKRRLKAALQEMKQADNFEYRVVNDKIDKTVKEVQSILSMERKKRQGS
jgi:guanylate kinase